MIIEGDMIIWDRILGMYQLFVKICVFVARIYNKSMIFKFIQLITKDYEWKKY